MPRINPPPFFFLTSAFLDQLQQMSELCDDSAGRKTGVLTLLLSLRA